MAKVSQQAGQVSQAPETTEDFLHFGEHLRELLRGLVGAEPSGGTVFRRDSQAEQEAVAELNRLLEAFKVGDVELISSRIADEGFTTIFELAPGDASPRTLRTKEEIREYIEELVDFPKLEEKFRAVTAVANSTLALVVEEGTVVVRRPEGGTQLQPLRASSVLRRGDDGWKWVHWHISELAPRRDLDESDTEIDLDLVVRQAERQQEPVRLD